MDYCHSYFIQSTPRQTHRYFTESISESIHVKTMLCSPDNAWRIPFLKELLLAQSNHLLINDFDNVDLSDMISAVMFNLIFFYRKNLYIVQSSSSLFYHKNVYIVLFLSFIIKT